MIRPILELKFPRDRRIIVVSDIHANIPYFQGILDKISFCDDDILIINGDFLEKGDQSLAMLRLVMEMAERGNTHVIRGNCDGWHELLDSRGRMHKYMHGYMLGRKTCFVRQIYEEKCGEFTGDIDITAVRDVLETQCQKEMDFLRNLPVIIETENYTFVHGGVSGNDIYAVNPYTCMKNDNFLGQGYSFNKWQIVGHWPVALYGEGIISANPIILEDRKIISIDGGTSIKNDGQLNALIIPYDGSFDFECVYYDDYETAIALDAQSASETSAYIRYGDNDITILEHGEEFSLCRHIRTGYVMSALTKYISSSAEGCNLDDSTDYELEVAIGDTLSIIERTSRGYFCKKKGISGWYRGKIDE